jgi:hypothetical protein
LTKPLRLTLSRAKGFNLQQHSLAQNGLPAVNIARPGPLGNPFIIGEDGTRAECLHLFKMMVGGDVAITTRASVESQRLAISHIAENLKSLRNRNLACWCPQGAACHGDVLLELFNRPICRAVDELSAV